EAARLGLAQEGGSLHGDFGRAFALAIGPGGRQHQRAGMRFHLGVDALLRTADERVATLNLGVDAAIAAGPIRMLAKQADAPRDNDLHISAPDKNLTNGTSIRTKVRTRQIAHSLAPAPPWRLSR